MTELAAVLAGMFIIGGVTIAAMMTGNTSEVHYLVMTLDGVAVAYFIRSIKGAVDRDALRSKKSEARGDDDAR